MPRFGGMGAAFGRMGAGGKVPAAAAPFTPASLSNLALWIDPSDTATMFQSNAGTTAVTDGSACGFAGDKSGASFNLTSVADDTTRPTWVNNSGLPYLNFDGSNDIIRRAATLNLYNSAAAVSVFMAIRANPATSTFFITEDNSGGNAYVAWAKSNGTTASTAELEQRNDAGTGTQTVTTATSIFGNTDKVYGVIDNLTGATGYIDGVAQTPQVITRGGTFTIDRFAVGSLYRVDTPASWFASRLSGLIIVKRALSAGEIAQITTYLGAKQGRAI